MARVTEADSAADRVTNACNATPHIPTKVSQKKAWFKSGQAPLCEAPSGPFRQRRLTLLNHAKKAKAAVSTRDSGHVRFQKVWRL
jgi:hypothetical protein